MTHPVLQQQPAKEKKGKKGKKKKIEKWTGPKLRPVFWEKLKPKQLKGTVWEASDPDIKFDTLKTMFPGLTDVFELKEKKKKKKDGGMFSWRTQWETAAHITVCEHRQEEEEEEGRGCQVLGWQAKPELRNCSVTLQV